MPQVFQVLRCYKCLVFQVHQTKKSNKWECKMCSAKQSVKRHYGIGTAKDCRFHVQKLNGIRGKIDELQENKNIDSNDEEEFIENSIHIEECGLKPSKSQTKSKWSDYIVKNDEVTKPVQEDTMHLNNTEIVLELPKKRKKAGFKTPVLKKHLGNSNFEDKTTDNSQINVNSFTSNPSYDSDDDNLVSIKMTHSETIYEAKKYLPNSYFTKHELLYENQQLPVYDKKTVSPKLVSQKVNSSSKWAQFVEDNDENNIEDKNKNDPPLSLNEDNFQSKKGGQLFALCDDGDLDSVLDI